MKRGLNADATFTHAPLREAHDVDAGKTLAEAHLDLDGLGLNAEEASRLSCCKHAHSHRKTRAGLLGRDFRHLPAPKGEIVAKPLAAAAGLPYNERLMSLIAAFKKNGPSGYGYRTTAEQVTEGLDLRGKTMLVTGSNSGIGRETARVLAKRGAHVIAAARTVEKARAVAEQLDGEVTAVACELSEPSSVRACVDKVKTLGRPLDALVCNAGIMALPKLEQKHGFELQFLTNHIGHFILVTGLVDSLSDDGRVVMLSSDAHHGTYDEGIQFDNLNGERGYRPWKAYGQSKLANLLFAKELAERLQGTAKTANSVHPGVIHTNLARNMNPVVNAVLALGAPLVLKSMAQGAATQTYVATHPDVATVSGEHFSDCNIDRPSRHGRDAQLAKKLWTTTEEIVAGL